MQTKFNSIQSLVGASALVLVLGLSAGQTQALVIDLNDASFSTTWILGTNYWTSTDQANLKDLSEINAAFLTSYTGLTSAYKADVGTVVSESGPYADYYSTVFSNSSTDPEDALITWDGGLDPYIVCPTCFLLVKDGNASPAQYLFDLGSWDGVQISLENFWPTQGAISHIEIYSSSSTSGQASGGTSGQASTSGGQVPEPGVLALLGAGLLGQAFLLRQRRRRLQK
jgi:hypothetical protein